MQNGVSSTRPLQNGQNGPPSVESPLAIEMAKLNSVVPPAVSTTCLIPRREQNELSRTCGLPRGMEWKKRKNSNNYNSRR